MKITTNDGREYMGITPNEIVKAMQADSWWANDPKKEYMAGIAERMELQTGKPMLYSTPDEFLRELANRGLVTIAD